MVQQLMDMGGGNWDKDTVERALRAALNNPERAVEYLYSVCTICFCLDLSKERFRNWYLILFISLHRVFLQQEILLLLKF